MGYLVMAACLGSFLLACSVSPGVVRPAIVGAAPATADGAANDGNGGIAREGVAVATKRRYECYPHDGVVFVEGFCKTCLISK